MDQKTLVQATVQFTYTRTNNSFKPLTISGTPHADSNTFHRNGIIIPCPENGEIYIMEKKEDGAKELSKTQFIVPKLVEKCPIQSTDAMFQGQKKDTWIELDWNSGEVLLTSADKPMLKCEGDPNHVEENHAAGRPSPTASSIIAIADAMDSITLTKTDYQFTKKDRYNHPGEVLWNITYLQFQLLNSIPDNYPMKHYYAENILTTTNRNGMNQWNLVFESPIVKLFTWSKKFAAMLKVPSEHLAVQALDGISMMRESIDMSEVDSSGMKEANGVKLKESLRLKVLNDHSIYAELIWTGPTHSNIPALTSATADTVATGLVDSRYYDDISVLTLIGHYEPAGKELDGHEELCFCNFDTGCIHVKTNTPCEPEEGTFYRGIYEVMKRNFFQKKKSDRLEEAKRRREARLKLREEEKKRGDRDVKWTF